MNIIDKAINDCLAVMRKTQTPCFIYHEPRDDEDGILDTNRNNVNYLAQMIGTMINGVAEGHGISPFQMILRVSAFVDIKDAVKSGNNVRAEMLAAKVGLMFDNENRDN